jgi:hypothetical protein
MPLPMVHLAIAVQLAARQGRFPSAPFLLGSISPDAIHMRPNVSPVDKAATHLKDLPATPNHDEIRALLEGHSDMPAFTAGYAAHVLTDRLWVAEVVEAFWARVPEAKQDTRHRLYYQQTDQVDFNLYHHAPWRPEVWERLGVAESVDFPPLLSAGEIAGWRDRTLRWFEEPRNEPGITPEYITDAVVGDFIHHAPEYIETHFAAWGVKNSDL